MDRLPRGRMFSCTRRHVGWEVASRQCLQNASFPCGRTASITSSDFTESDFPTSRKWNEGAKRTGSVSKVYFGPLLLALFEHRAVFEISPPVCAAHCTGTPS